MLLVRIRYVVYVHWCCSYSSSTVQSIFFCSSLSTPNGHLSLFLSPTPSTQNKNVKLFRNTNFPATTFHSPINPPPPHLPRTHTVTQPTKIRNTADTATHEILLGDIKTVDRVLEYAHATTCTNIRDAAFRYRDRPEILERWRQGRGMYGWNWERNERTSRTDVCWNIGYGVYGRKGC